ncbi:MAG: protoporphyrinogen oxidase [Desulforhopalus sp.]
MNKNFQTIILGGGLSGLTVAHKLRLQNPGHRFCLLEKGGRTGGVIRTNIDKGYITEIGPHGFLDNCLESKQILAETGLDSECVKAPLIDFVRYVYLNGKLNLIPQTPGKILRAPLIPWHAKMRVLAELWQPVLEGEPTVAKWVNHRFGSALLPFLDAVYTGTYAGDFNRLTIDSVMPGVRALEKEHGSVLRGLLAKFRQKKKQGRGEPKTTFSMPAMTSFPAGMQRLPERLSEHLTVGQDLQLNTTVTAVQADGSGWQVITSKGSFHAENVIFALPVNIALQLLDRIDPTLPEKSIPETWIASVVFGFDDSVKIPPGFGYLTPEQEQRFTLGSLFSSNMFPGRAPEGHIVFETLVGGRRHPERLELDDKTLTHLALQDVREILNVPKVPAYTAVLRSNGGIPQLERNYPKLLAWRRNFLATHPGVDIIGFGWEGIGLNDMMKCGCRAAETVLSSSAATQHDADVKGIYF